MSSQRRESTSQAAARRWKSRIRRFLLACFFLQLVVVGTGHDALRAIKAKLICILTFDMQILKQCSIFPKI